MENIVEFLSQCNMLNAKNIALTEAHINPIALARGMCLLIKAEILNQKNFDILVRSNAPDYKATDILILNYQGLLTHENQLLLTIFSNRLTIPCTLEGESELFSNVFRYQQSILIMTTEEEEYQRISNLIPQVLNIYIANIEIYRKIKEIQQMVFANVYLSHLNLPNNVVQLIQQYDNLFYDLINEVPLPFHDEELPLYFENLNIVLDRFEAEQFATTQSFIITDKLNQVIKCAEQAMLKAEEKPSFFMPEQNQSRLAMTVNQIELTRKLVRWFKDDSETITSDEIALLAQHSSVRLILANDYVEHPKLSLLEKQFREADECSTLLKKA